MPAIIPQFAFTGSTVCLPLLNTIASELVNTSRRGRMMGATTTSASIGRILGPLLAAVLLSKSITPPRGWARVWCCAGALGHSPPPIAIAP